MRRKQNLKNKNRSKRKKMKRNSKEKRRNKKRFHAHFSDKNPLPSHSQQNIHFARNVLSRRILLFFFSAGCWLLHRRLPYLECFINDCYVVSSALFIFTLSFGFILFIFFFSFFLSDLLAVLAFFVILHHLQARCINIIQLNSTMNVKSPK